MIHELRIEDLGVISAAVCGFDRGFTAVTGETGAGKTMVVTGLGLLSGGRADTALVRSGAPRASVEGAFDLAVDHPLAGVVRDAGGIVDGDGLTAARIVADRGRSVLGGRTVPTATMADVVGQLLVIHGQLQQGRLGARAGQLLDAFAGPEVTRLAAQVAAGHDRLRSLTAQLADLRDSAQSRARELDSLTQSLEEISAIDPQPDEDRSLAVEAKRLEHADTLVRAARTAREAIVADADYEAPLDAMGLLSTARRALESGSEHDDSLGAHAASIRSVMAQLSDVGAELSAYAQDVDADPQRLAVLMDRRAELARLTRKYGDDVEAVRAWAQQAASRVAELAGADDRIEGLAAAAAELRADLGRRAGELHEARVAAAHEFAERVSAELSALAMPRAQVAFEVSMSPDPDGVPVPGVDGPVALRPSGVDRVALVLAAHPGAPRRPVAQAASGGELSRVMLAIQVVLAGADPVPTMVFDEVDAGVGGAAAIEVGRRLQRLSALTQVIVVTHLAQVAAFADRQLVVAKDTDGTVTASSVREVAGPARVRELSRMLGGMADSQAAGAHAEELLELARSESRGEAGPASMTWR